MKIALASDLHLEFGPIVLENTQGAEVLILSGDICVARDLDSPDQDYLSHKKERITDFFWDVCNKFPHVVYVMGNHEHYHGEFNETVTILKRELKFPNLQILDNQVWDYHGEYRFVGGTLWTDMNNEDDVTLQHIRGMMNDFRCVYNEKNQVTYKKFVPIYDENGVHKLGEDGKPTFQAEFSTRTGAFTPQDAVAEHKKMLRLIEKSYDPQMKMIVVGHHAPSKASTHPRYADETLMNGGYSSDLNQFMMDHPMIKLWTHGHTHEDFDYMIGTTRVSCNPRGYINYEDRADRFELKFIEV